MIQNNWAKEARAVNVFYFFSIYWLELESVRKIFKGR